MTPAEQIAEAILNAAGTKLANYMPSTKEAILAAAEPYARAVEQAAFLLERIADLDWSMSMDDFAREHSGHVDPAIERLRSTLAAIQEPSK